MILLFRFKAIGFILSLFLGLSTGVHGQQNGSKTQPKTNSQSSQSPKGTQGKVSQDDLQKALGEVLKKQEDIKQQKAENSLGYEIDGLLIDATLTKVGHDFYDIFYSNWEAPANVRDYSISIIERPLRGRGFQIVIAVNDTEIIEESLQPNMDMLEQSAYNALQVVTDYLLNYEKLKHQLESDQKQQIELF